MSNLAPGTTTTVAPDGTAETVVETVVTDADKILELVDSLHLAATANVLATLWDWAGRHFGLVRPPTADQAAANVDAAATATVPPLAAAFGGGAIPPVVAPGPDAETDSRLTDLEATLATQQTVLEAIAAKLGV